jgi:hypothetical protein
MGWIKLAQDCDEYWAVVNMLTNHWIPYIARNFLTRWGTDSFSRRTSPHGARYQILSLFPESFCVWLNIYWSQHMLKSTYTEVNIYWNQHMLKSTYTEVNILKSTYAEINICWSQHSEVYICWRQHTEVNICWRQHMLKSTYAEVSICWRQHMLTSLVTSKRNKAPTL